MSATWGYTQLRERSWRTQFYHFQTETYHSYQDNFYISMRIAQTLLDRNVRVCGTVRANRGILRDLEEEGKSLNKGQSAFQRKGNNGANVEGQKTCVNDKYDP